MLEPDNSFGLEPIRRTDVRRMGVRSLAVRRPARLAAVLLCLLWLPTLLTSCASVRPIAKLGLIAPFEGLHRRSGYEALDAVRTAIAAAPPGPIDFLPLALHAGDTPQQVARTAAKLLADPEVRAVIGPLSPQAAASAAPALAKADPLWLAPFAVAPAGGFAPLNVDGDSAGGAPTAWADELVAAVGQWTVQAGYPRLALAGLSPGWPAHSAARWSEIAGLPVILPDTSATLPAYTVVFWMGGAEEGAAFLAELRSRQPAAPFWLGPAGGDPVFFELAPTLEQVYWAIWLDQGYTDWAETYSHPTPTAYIVYLAAQQAIYALLDLPPPPVRWAVAQFSFANDRTPVPVSFERSNLKICECL